MKRSLVIVITSITLIASLTGCSKFLDRRNAESISSNKSAKDTTNLTINKVKELDDSKLIEQISAGEEALNLEDVDSITEDLDAIDAILNEKDPIAGIPANVKVDK
jgi:acetylglutamate synthase